MPLMTYEEYAKIEYEHKIPYTFILKYGSNYLYYFGEDHSYDPSNSQWTLGNSFWSDFLEKTDGDKRVAFVEGGKPTAEATEAEAIVKSGGGGFIAYLSHRDGVDLYSPEPRTQEQREKLEKVFSKEQIQYYYFARLIPQWHRKQNPKPDFESYMNSYLEYHRKSSGWTDFDFSLDSMEKIHREIFGTDFNKDDIEFFKNITTPVESKTIINKVARACSDIRDTYIVDQIKKYLNEGYSVYIQYGCTHAVRQEPLLREFVNA